jgi:hypothetical protein
MSGLAEAFAELDGIEAASVHDNFEPSAKFARLAIRMRPEVGPLILLLPLNELLDEDPRDVAAFYSECIAQQVRMRRGECIFCGSDCGCEKPRILRLPEQDD